jgi:hypothetical protein
MVWTGSIPKLKTISAASKRQQVTDVKTELGNTRVMHFAMGTLDSGSSPDHGTVVWQRFYQKTEELGLWCNGNIFVR